MVTEVTRHIAPEVRQRLDEVDPGDLPTLALRHLGGGEFDCVDPDRRIYASADGTLYRSPYVWRNGRGAAASRSGENV